MFLLQFLQSRDLHRDTLCLTLVQFQHLAFLCIIFRLATDYPVFVADLLQWRLFCSSELKHTQVGFCPDLNPPLFRPKSSFSFSSSFFHGRCWWSSVFLLSSFSLKGFLSTYLRKFSTSSSSPSSRMPIVLGTFTSSSTKFVDLSYYVQSCRDSMKALQPLVAKNARRSSSICCRWQTKQWMQHAIVFSF